MANEKRLIYAEDAKRLFDDIPPFIGMTGKCVQEMLDKAPTVDAVEVVHGEWVHHYYDSGEPIDDKWYCSECHMCNDHRRTWYCPHCGAKMDRERKENETT